MLNLTVLPAVRNRRLEACKACKFYNKTFGTCGTPVIGNEVLEDNQVTYYKEKIRLCGCIMSIKTKLRFASCPARKWFAESFTESEISELKAFIVSVDGRSSLESSEVHRLYEYVNKLSSRRYKISTCPTCIVELIDALKTHLDIKPVTLTELKSTDGLTPEMKHLINNQ